ncbi:hypothetical protein [Cohnella fermenti]|uniref:S-layer homology domain-containing protein n=1 Tax=Cohnella fermenti TaxID=2565925 RepID=A0A4S4BH67_9BACL|nr:hypothetical protein [Cohnella fermenti]THF73867.1 hypothetical protein E6C55_27545 [Cohnella fermenti]
MRSKILNKYVVATVASVALFTSATTVEAAQFVKKAVTQVSTASLFNTKSTDSLTNGNVEIASKLVYSLGTTLEKATSFKADDVIKNAASFFGKPVFVYGNLVANVGTEKDSAFYKEHITNELYLYDQYNNYYKVYVSSDDVLNYLGDEQVILSGYIVGLEDIQYEGEEEPTTHIVLVANQRSIEEIEDLSDLESFPSKKSDIDYFRILNEYVKYFDYVVDNYDPTDEEYNFGLEPFNATFSTFLNKSQQFKNEYTNWADLTFEVLLDEKYQTIGINDLIKNAYNYKLQFKKLVEKQATKAVTANTTILSLLKEGRIRVGDANFSTDPGRARTAVSMLYSAVWNYYEPLLKENKKDDRYYYEIVEFGNEISDAIATVKENNYWVYNVKVFDTDETGTHTLKYLESYFAKIKI